MAIQIRDPFALSRSLWQLPSLMDTDWVEAADQGLSLYETDDSVVVEANVAGVPDSEVDVSIEGGTVTIKAEHSETDEDRKQKKVIYRQARSYRYLYTASLPTAVDQNAATAVIEQGILKLTLPKKEEAKPKKIQVSLKK